MKYILISIAFLMPHVFGQEKKHQVSFSSNYSAGWSGEAFSSQTKSNSSIDAFEGIDGELMVNYAYRMTQRVQLGFAFSSFTDETTLEFSNGQDRDLEMTKSSVLIFGTYNFNDDFSKSFYTGAGLSTEISESEIQGSNTDYIASGLSVFVGKRFPLTRWGIENLTYAPMVTFTAGLVSGDLEDSGVERINTTTLDIIKFDLLF